MALRYDCGEVITAMVTPMERSGAIDYDKVESLAKHLIESGSDTLLVAGTTGESPTLTNEEEIELVNSVKRAVANKAKIILGAGSNSQLVRQAESKRTRARIQNNLFTIFSPFYLRS